MTSGGVLAPDVIRALSGATGELDDGGAFLAGQVLPRRELAALVDQIVDRGLASPQAVAEARAVKDAFSRAENTGKGVIALNGKMVERLHLAQAEKLLAKAAAIGA